MRRPPKWRPLAVVALLTCAAPALAAQAVPEGSQAETVPRGYRRPVQLRMDPFRHILVPHWGFVMSGGVVAANNSLNVNDARALETVASGPGLSSSHVLDAVNLVREGSGLEADGVAQAGLYLGGPIGGLFAIGLSGNMRAYGFGVVPEDAVALLKEGNVSQTTFSFDGTRAVTLETVEAGAHAVLRFGPLGGEDGVHATFGFGGRLIWPQYYFNASADAASQVSFGGTTNANVNMGVLRSTDFAFGTNLGSGFAADFLLRLEWPTSALALEAMVANVGQVTVNGLIQDTWSVNVNSSSLLDFVDSLDVADFQQTASGLQTTVKLPRIVRFSGSSWANRYLQIDLSGTLAVHDEFDTPTIVNLGTTWRFLSWMPLHAGLEMNGRSGLGFTLGVGVESRNFLFRVYGGSLGGWINEAKGGAARLELGVFF